jgi:uncharacterized protein YbjT (DUF2867 family)
VSRHCVFVTGATGYIGRPTVARLLARGHSVRALARARSEHRSDAGATTIVANALDAESFEHAVAPADTIVHLVGTPHPNPAKAREFHEVDLASIVATVRAATTAHVSHVVYLSVAHPAPLMQSYIAVRVAGETIIRASGITATFLRPWYVLGPGHYWPMLLRPAYALFESIAATRASALRLGLVTLDQMVCAIVGAVENPPESTRVLGVPEIRSAWSALDPAKR